MNALLIFATTFFAILKIIAVALGGYVLARKGIFHKQLTKDMGKVIFQFMVPCMIFGNIIENVDIERAKMVAILFAFPVITHCIGFSLGQIFRLILKLNSEEEEYMLIVAGSTFGNHGNIAVPLLGAILDDPRGPFINVPNAKGKGTAYVMIYMSMCSVLVWGVGMPWFKKRNNKKKQKLQKEERSLVEEPNKEKEPKEANGDAIITPSPKQKPDSMKNSLLKDAQEGEREDMVQLEVVEGEHRPDGPPGNFITTEIMPFYNSLLIKISPVLTAVKKSYIYELLTLPPVFALSVSLTIAFIVPLRDFLMTTYADILPNTATFIGDASIPIVLMFLGANLADKSPDARLSKKITISVVVARLVLLPTIGISLVYFLIKMNWLPDDIILHFLLMIQFSMPSAVNLILACQIAGGGEAKMSSLLFWQYVVCSITISVCCIIVQFILL